MDRIGYKKICPSDIVSNEPSAFRRIVSEDLVKLREILWNVDFLQLNKEFGFSFVVWSEEPFTPLCEYI